MAKVEVTMPKMGESITEGTVIEWHKQPGDAIELDESLLEIGTDKVDTEVPSPVAGVLSEILVSAGSVVDVGTLLAWIETDASAVTNGESSSESGPQESEKAEVAVSSETVAAAPEPAQASVATSGDSSRGGSHVDVVMPKMGESIVDGTVLSWAKKIGDTIDLDETLLEIATDKVDTEVPSPAAGTLVEILVQEGETVDVGARIAVIATGAPASEKVGDSSAVPGPASIEPPKVSFSETSVDVQPASSVGTPVEGSGSSSRFLADGRFLSPLVRSIMETEHVSVAEVETIQGSGHEGRISKKDILEFIKTRNTGASAAPSRPVGTDPSTSASEAAKRKLLSAELPVPGKPPGERVEVVKMDRMRQLISEHMTRSVATSAHVTSFAEVDVTRLVRVRERNKTAFLAREGVKLTYTPFFVFAAVEALRDHPILNASVEGTDILYKKDYHIGIAVAIGNTGLVVPVIHDAGQKNIVGLAHAAADLATRTRSKRLLPDQLQGGTFTVTNVGSLGSIMGTPIINQPQVGILATGAITKRPVVIEDPVLGDTIAIRSMMFVSLSYDHRVVDGAMGSSFLAKFRSVLESLDPHEEI